MQFKLSTSGSDYSPEAKEKLEQIGFRFREVIPGTRIGNTKQRFFRICNEDDIEITINTSEELMDFIKEYGYVVVSDNPPSIEIYDDYRE